MKILCLLPLFFSLAHADTLRLDRYDQLKLAELLARLPETVKMENSEKDDSIPGLQKKYLSFPNAEADFRIFCESHYYNDSPYTSFAECLFEIDPNGRSIDHSYDEYRIQLKGELAKGLLKAIPHGQPRREIRSWQRDSGTNFKGQRSEIFRYYFSCGEADCEIYVSEKGLKRN